MTTLAEPEWDAETRELALALDAVDLCSVCGGPRSLCHDPKTAYSWVAEAHRCYRQTAVLDRSNAMRQDNEDPQLEAVEWKTRRLDTGGGP